MTKSKNKQSDSALHQKGTKKQAGDDDEVAKVDPETARKIVAVRSQVRENFGNVAMAMMLLPRYRHQTLADLQHLLLAPLVRDRVAIAYPARNDNDETHNHLADVTGMAIWASVSDEVDAKIRDQIGAGTFPLRLNDEDWASGEINWLIDIIAPDRKSAAGVIASFGQVVKKGNLRLHPIVSKLVDKEALEDMGAWKLADTH